MYDDPDHLDDNPGVDPDQVDFHADETERRDEDQRREDDERRHDDDLRRDEYYTRSLGY